MKKNEFDTHAKSMLDGLETPLNTDALWDNVHAELYPEKKKRFGWIWFSASSFLAVLLLLGYMYMSNTTTSENNIVLKDKVDQKLEANIESQKIKTTTTTVTPSEASVNTLESKNEPQTNESNVAKNKITSQNNAQKEINTPIIKLNTKNAVLKNFDTTPENTPYILNVPQAKNMMNQSILNTKVTEIQNIITNGPINNKAKNLKTKTPQRNVTPIETKIDTPNIKVIEDETPPLIIADKAEDPEEPTLVMPEEDDGGDGGIDMPNKKLQRKFQFGVGFNAGISNSFTTLSSEVDDDDRLLNLREESESNLETIDLGLDVLLQHKSGVYLSTGIEYFRSARRFDYNKEVIDEELIDGTKTIFINPITMDSTFEQGEILQTTTRTDTKEIYNNLHLINIPVNLGFARDYKRWTFGVQGGASFNVYLRQKGQIRIGEESFYDLGEDSENWFKDNLDISFQGAALLGYNFTDNFQIVGGPSFRSSMLLSESINPIRQSQVGLGVQMSARYWFN